MGTLILAGGSVKQNSATLMTCRETSQSKDQRKESISLVEEMNENQERIKYYKNNELHKLVDTFYSTI